MSDYSVTYDEMTRVANLLETGMTDMQGTLANLQSEVQKLIEAGFTTNQASGAFLGSYEQFTSGANNTVNGLTGMTGFLRTAVNVMQEGDQAMAAAVPGA